MEIIVVSTLLMLAVSAIITLFICLHYYFKKRKHLITEVEKLKKIRKNWDDIIERFDNGKQTAEDIIESKKYVWLTYGYSHPITKSLLKKELDSFDCPRGILDPGYEIRKQESFFYHLTTDGNTDMSKEELELLKKETAKINNYHKASLRKKQKTFTYLMKKRFKETFGGVVFVCFMIAILSFGIVSQLLSR